MVDIALAEAFEERREKNAKVANRLVWFLALALASLLLETIGLGMVLFFTPFVRFFLSALAFFFAGLNAF